MIFFFFLCFCLMLLNIFFFSFPLLELAALSRSRQHRPSHSSVQSDNGKAEFWFLFGKLKILHVCLGFGIRLFEFIAVELRRMKDGKKRHFFVERRSLKICEEKGHAHVCVGVGDEIYRASRYRLIVPFIPFLFPTWNNLWRCHAECRLRFLFHFHFSAWISYIVERSSHPTRKSAIHDIPPRLH